MPTLSLIHESPLLDPESIPRILRSAPSWRFERTSSNQGSTKPYYSLQGGTKMMVLPQEWTRIDIQDFYTLWSHMVLTSVELSEQDYEHVISTVKNRSHRPTPQVGRDN